MTGNPFRPLAWDCYEFAVAGDYLPSIINGDDSGLDQYEVQWLLEFEQTAKAAAVAAGWTVGHWDADLDGGESFRTCAVCGLRAMCYTVRLHVFKR